MTLPTPDTCEIRCAITVSVASKIALVGMVSEVSARTSAGAPEELALRKVGRIDRSVGRSVMAALIAACTSRAAASTLRSMSNCAVICVTPSELIEVSSLRLEMLASRRSSGAATDAAMVSGSAPGRAAVMLMIGKSTAGRLATGRRK